jgi:hypothetical protein
MPTYGRVVGFLSLAGLLGFLVLSAGANARPEPERGDPLVPQACPAAHKVTQVPCEEDAPAKAPRKKGKETKAAQREALVAELLPILEKTRSAAAFMMTLEALVALDAPVEKVVPVCLRALENLDKFKPLPTEKEEAQEMLLEGIGECVKVLIDKRVKVVKGGQAWTPGVTTLPAATYLEHPPQYIPPDLVPGLGWGLPGAPGLVGSIPPGMGFLPVPTCPPHAPQPAPPAPRPVISEPVPVARPMPATSSLPQGMPLGPPIPADVSGGIIPVSTLPPALPVKLEALSPSNSDPARLVPVPMPE